MILSDTLSQRLDHCPEEDKNEEAILLPNSLLLNLLDLTLQDRIANAKDYDFDITNTIAILLEEGPSGIQSVTNSFSSLTHAYHAFYFSFSYLIDMHFP